MGVDVHIYAEKKTTGQWELFMPPQNYNEIGRCESFDVGRIPALFQVLSRLYGDNYGKDFKSLSDNRGIPADACNDIVEYMEGLTYCSYVYLSEIMAFDWDSESEQYYPYKEIVGEEFFDTVVKHMQSALEENVSEKDIRIVFGYSA